MWNKLSGVPERRLVVSQSDVPITCAEGLSVVPHVTFEQKGLKLSEYRHRCDRMTDRDFVLR